MSDRKENLLLSALPLKERERLDPFLELVSVKFEETVVGADEPIRHVFFPNNAVISTVQEMADGGSIETGLVGAEGMVGVAVWLHVPSATTREVAQVPGSGYQMKTADFIREVRDSPSPLNQLLARYTHGFLSMTSILAACNRLHTLDQRMCRWLKLVHDRVRSDEFPMRQQFMAQMLGVQRPTVSTTAFMLQQAGLITYTRGQMKVLNPKGLVEGACTCYGMMEREMNRIYEVPWRQVGRGSQEAR